MPKDGLMEVTYARTHSLGNKTGNKRVILISWRFCLTIVVKKQEILHILGVGQ